MFAQQLALLSVLFCVVISASEAQNAPANQPTRPPIRFEVRKGLKEEKLRDQFGILIEHKYDQRGNEIGWVFLLDDEGNAASVDIANPQTVTYIRLDDCYDSGSPRVVIQFRRESSNAITFTDYIVVPKLRSGYIRKIQTLPRAALVSDHWFIYSTSLVSLIERCLKAGVRIFSDQEEISTTDSEGGLISYSNDFLIFTFPSGKGHEKNADGGSERVQVTGGNVAKHIERILGNWEQETLKEEALINEGISRALRAARQRREEMRKKERETANTKIPE